MNSRAAALSDEDRAAQPNLIELHDVSITYEFSHQPAVSHIDFQLKKGESVLFLGPSGCGKSTVAMLCSGLIPGSIEADVTGGVNRDESVTKPGGVGYVFQDPDAQFCMIRVADEVSFGLENLQVDPFEMPRRITQALGTVGLAAHEGEQHAQFSGGMKQKLAIASALAMDPQLLVFDEPTANLDPYATSQVFAEIRRLVRSGQSLLVIEHKFDGILNVMDRVVLFNHDGTIHRTGSVQEVIPVEWQWMVETGIVSPWKQPPADLAVQPFPTDGSIRHRKPVAGTAAGVIAHKDDADDGGHDTAIAFSGAAFRYGSKRVWRDVDLAIPSASFVAILGPNGVGKSSLLQTIAGLSKLSQGELTVAGKPIRKWHLSDLAEKVSFCFQNPEFQFIYERVGDELANRVVHEQVPEEISQLLREFGLEGYEQHSPFALSQGQKRRLSVASMLRTEHDIYLLDEPTFGQDAKTQKMIMDRMVQIHEDGKTILMTTHDIDLVQRYATHVVVLAGGELRFFGSPADLWQQPDVLREAHLVADRGSLPENLDAPLGSAGAEDIPTAPHGKMVARSHSASSGNMEALWSAMRPSMVEQRGMALNPVWKLISVMLFAGIAMFANQLMQSLSLFVLSIVIMIFFGRLSIWTIAKRFAPFWLFYVLYVFTFVAYSRVPAGAPSLHLLWMNLSWQGLYNGGVLAFRMLSAVGAAIFLISTTDMTDMVVSLCTNAKVPPKFSYGILAGLRLIPLFQNEWIKLRQARQLRGRDAKKAWLRPVTYALPLLGQAIRMSERVAVAMEARGLVGAAAKQPSQRTYLRTVPLSWRDGVFAVFLNFGAILLLVLLR